MAARPLRHSGMALPSASRLAIFAFFGAVANASYALLRVCPNGLPTRFRRGIMQAFRAISLALGSNLRDTLLPPENSNAMEILTFYGPGQGRTRAKQLQRRLTHAVFKREAEAFMRDSAPIVRARALASRARWASLWLSSSVGESRMIDEAYAQAARMRCNLAPAETMPSRCWCGVDFAQDQWHSLSHSAGNPDAMNALACKPGLNRDIS